MPKLIELTIEIEIQRVSCPGVWLCQDGRVSLSVYALGTSYQTCLLPPVFPLMFKDIFYFRKRFQDMCGITNVCCLLKDETIYCELVQWSENCNSGQCSILGQYLGALDNVLFPPNMCSNDGVDLLMRRSKEFPGILSPKIEIATKVRIDEVWNKPSNNAQKTSPCQCDEAEAARQRPVCHSPQYHRKKCFSSYKRPTSGTRSRSRSRSGGSRSCCSLTIKQPELIVTSECPKLTTMSKQYKQCRRSPSRRPIKCPEYNVYNMKLSDAAWLRNDVSRERINDDDVRYRTDKLTLPNDERLQKIILESRCIEEELDTPTERPQRVRTKITPCVCEICKRYHQLFHTT